MDVHQVGRAATVNNVIHICYIDLVFKRLQKIFLIEI